VGEAEAVDDATVGSAGSTGEEAVLVALEGGATSIEVEPVGRGDEDVETSLCILDVDPAEGEAVLSGAED
jgi:hypothetical protein